MPIGAVGSCSSSTSALDAELALEKLLAEKKRKAEEAGIGAADPSLVAQQSVVAAQLLAPAIRAPDPTADARSASERRQDRFQSDALSLSAALRSSDLPAARALLDARTGGRARKGESIYGPQGEPAGDAPLPDAAHRLFEAIDASDVTAALDALSRMLGDPNAIE